ncbi:MAG: type II toxin-antitoxin system VapC family toxin [Chloroflexota bacterium]
MIVLDTAALIYWTLNPDDLTKTARFEIDKSEKIIVSSISIWEIGLKSTRGRLKLGGTIQEYVQALEKVNDLEIQAVESTVWIENLMLDWDHRDPADRTIVATAKILDCPLITSDRKIRDFYPKSVW